jgi:hypothetical protein
LTIYNLATQIQDLLKDAQKRFKQVWKDEDGTDTVFSLQEDTTPKELEKHRLRVAISYQAMLDAFDVLHGDAGEPLLSEWQDWIRQKVDFIVGNEAQTEPEEDEENPTPEVVHSIARLIADIYETARKAIGKQDWADYELDLYFFEAVFGV